ncbi:putative lipoprotein [Enhygromyxa salina]|uniref:Putative lipoprotein n=1 Tax=Enhygromyxa salina TaxID=215803 RepID=A0A0C2A601_9BACT|nr:hypothetical protein [Enhygromyxa salina]KIG18808.1 putative lipoprotein [Enhygromyxa salina]
MICLTTSWLTACGDPCLDDGRGKAGAVCDNQTGADDSGTAEETATGAEMEETAEAEAEETAEAEAEETAEEGEGATWCEDTDADGFGDPDNCTEVPVGEEPPAGTVPEDMATDCDDADPNTFPGAAELDDPIDACMTDADNDGWGDDMPSSPEAVPGHDCDDSNIFTFPGAAELDDPMACMQDEDEDGYGEQMPSEGIAAGSDCNDGDIEVFMCTLWCADNDSDGKGDEDMCIGVPPGELPPEFYVDNDDDCDDTNPFIFVGAADLDDPDACMLDADDDGWGDDFAGEMPPEGVVVGRDCDDGNEMRVVCVDTSPSCADTNLGMGTQLDAMAWGGDGNYTWLWDHEMTLDDAMSPSPIAQPTEITTYTATATDGSGNVGSDQITVHLIDRPWVLGGMDAECMAVGFLGAPAPHSFSNMNTTTCTDANSDATAYVCPTVHENARITGTMIVNPPVDDDDYIGFVWGWQNSDQYYMLQWKQAYQFIFGCDSPAGITVKRFNRVDPYSPTDFACITDTANQTVLMPPEETTMQGWVHGVTYGVEVLYANDQTEITITDTDNNLVIANFVVMDDTYPSGKFGTYDFSQVRACNGPWNSTCL